MNITGSESLNDDTVRIMTNRRENVFSYSVSMAVGLILEYSSLYFHQQGLNMVFPLY